MLTVCVGGKNFATKRSNWEKSPVLRRMFDSQGPPYALDTTPRAFHYVLEWLMFGKLYVNCPDTETYGLLRKHAELLELEELSELLRNRVSLCQIIRLGMDKYHCDLVSLRKVKNLGGALARMLKGHCRFLDNGTDVLCVCDCEPFAEILAYPLCSRICPLLPSSVDPGSIPVLKDGETMRLPEKISGDVCFVGGESARINEKIVRSAIILFGDAMALTVNRCGNSWHTQLAYKPEI